MAVHLTAIPAVETLAVILHQLPAAWACVELQLVAVQGGQIDLGMAVARIGLLPGQSAL